MRWGCRQLLVAVNRERSMPRNMTDVCRIRVEAEEEMLHGLKEVFFLTASIWELTCSREQGSGKGMNNASQASSGPKIALQMLHLTRSDRNR